MSEDKEKKNTKAKAHALAGWEWFKSAAWLQVLLIVGLVVGVVVAIPSVVSAISNAVANNTSNFYSNRQITYANLQNYLDGKNSDCNGTVGDENGNADSENQGFLVMFYKDDCDNCNSMQKNVENWYNKYNKTYANGNLRYYTIDVGWVPGDKAASASYAGQLNKYQNTYISLAQQFDVQQAVKTVYDKQDVVHKNTAVTDETLDTRLDSQTAAGTMPTPAFLLYTKTKTASTYEFTKPNKVIFGMEGKLSATDAGNVSEQMADIYNFSIYREA